MPCPTCGGSDRDPIAPAFWRCTSMRVVTREIGGPGLTDPRLGPGVLYEQHHVVCRTDYQEGVPGVSLLCECNTFAIGLCSECRKPVCGEHSAMVGDVRLCDAHIAIPRERADQARSDEQARACAKREEAWSDWEDKVAVELAHAQPAERIVRFIRIRSLEELKIDSYKAAERRTPGLGVTLRGLLPDLWSPEGIGAGWNDDEIHSWFVQAARKPPSAQDLHVPGGRRLLPNRRKQASALGWRIFTSAPDAQAYEHSWICVLADGRRGWEVGGACSLTDSPPAFSVYALWRMGAIAQLADLPRSPDPSSRYANWRLWGR